MHEGGGGKSKSSDNVTSWQNPFNSDSLCKTKRSIANESMTDNDSLVSKNVTSYFFPIHRERSSSRNTCPYINYSSHITIQFRIIERGILLSGDDFENSVRRHKWEEGQVILKRGFFYCLFWFRWRKFTKTLFLYCERTINKSVNRKDNSFKKQYLLYKLTL